MTIAEVVISVVLIVVAIALSRLIAHNSKEVKKLKRRLEKAGVIDIEAED